MAVQRVNTSAQTTRPQMINMIERVKPRLAQVATRYLSEDRLCALATSMWNKDSRLRQCSADSFLLALYKACQFGLDPTGIGNQGHIIAYRGQAEFVRGWGGVITMAARRGIKVDTFAVYDGDEFEVARKVTAEGYYLCLHHKELRDNPDNIGGVRAAYAVATCAEWEQPMIEVVWRHDIEKIRTNSASPNSPAWKGWYSEMARKTAVNRLAKRLPLFVEVKEVRGDSTSKISIPISGIPNEDTFYEGRVGNPVIDAPIDGNDKPERPSADPVGLIRKAMELREEFSDVYQQVFGRRDITKLSDNELTALIGKVEELGSFAESESATELITHEATEEELGF